MPLTNSQLNEFNRRIIEYVDRQDATEQQVAAGIRSVLEDYSERILVYVDALNEIPDGRGPGVDEWRVPSAAELRSRFDSELRESLANEVGDSADILTAELLPALASIADVDGSEGSYREELVAAFLAPSVGDSPADIWAQVHRRLRIGYERGSSLDEARGVVRELLYGRNDPDDERESEYRSRADSASTDEDRDAALKRASEIHAENVGWIAWRSETIATSIATGVAGATVYALATRNDLTATKTWLHMGDDRVRPQHLVLGGETVGVDDPFSNGLRFPGDPTGPIHQVANCRCAMLLATDRDNLEGDETLDEFNITAAAGSGPPAAWFEAPESVDADTPFVGEPDENGYRQVFGRAWYWDQCLLHGEQERVCRTPREFASDDEGFKFFHTLSNFVTKEGTKPEPGPLIFGHTGAVSAAQAKDVADDPFNVKAVVRLTEDEHGAVYSGAMLPSVTQEEADQLPATQISPEWWRIRPRSPLRLSVLSAVALGALRQNAEALMASACSDGLCVTGTNSETEAPSGEVLPPIPEEEPMMLVLKEVQALKDFLSPSPEPVEEKEEEKIEVEEEPVDTDALLGEVQSRIEKEVLHQSRRRYVDRRLPKK